MAKMGSPWLFFVIYFRFHIDPNMPLVTYNPASHRADFEKCVHSNHRPMIGSEGRMAGLFRRQAILDLHDLLSHQAKNRHGGFLQHTQPIPIHASRLTSVLFIQYHLFCLAHSLMRIHRPPDPTDPTPRNRRETAAAGRRAPVCFATIPPLVVRGVPRIAKSPTAPKRRGQQRALTR
jgi:hypothetical protein